MLEVDKGGEPPAFAKAESNEAGEKEEEEDSAKVEWKGRAQVLQVSGGAHGGDNPCGEVGEQGQTSTEGSRAFSSGIQKDVVGIAVEGQGIDPFCVDGSGKGKRGEGGITPDQDKRVGMVRHDG